MTRFGVAAEAAGDARAVCFLADRALRESVSWIEEGTIESCRTWHGAEPGETWLDLHRATKLARERRLKFYGHFRDEPGSLDAQMHRAVLLLFAELDDRPAMVVIARDVDDHDDRVRGPAQAKEECRWPFQVVGALAQPEIEAWFVCACPADAPQVEELRQELGFNPVLQSGRLSSSSGSARDAKSVLRRLVGSERTGVELLRTSTTDELCQRGRGNGLATFVENLMGTLTAMFRGGPEGSR